MNVVPCVVCGNEIVTGTRVCPHCDSPQPEPEPEMKKAVPRIMTIRIKEGLPTVKEALERLSAELIDARSKKIKLVRVIHGYGSSGVGGAIKSELPKFLNQARSDQRIKRFITGEEYGEYGGGRNPLLAKYPELQETWLQDRGNKGITFVEFQ